MVAGPIKGQQQHLQECGDLFPVRHHVYKVLEFLKAAAHRHPMDLNPATPTSATYLVVHGYGGWRLCWGCHGVKERGRHHLGLVLHPDLNDSQHVLTWVVRSTCLLS
jgi:hypothetical protein